MAGVRVAGLSYFNPHSPCGERPSTAVAANALVEFQSTLPLRGATRAGRRPAHNAVISIHTPLAGSDEAVESRETHDEISIHTPLAGSDLTWTIPPETTIKISIHTPLAGSDLAVDVPVALLHVISIHTPLAGSDVRRHRMVRPGLISIHTPLAGSDIVDTSLWKF